MSIIQQLAHKYLGWHYVLMTFEFKSKVRRVRFMPVGTPYVFIHGRSIEGPTTLFSDGKCGGAAGYWQWAALTTINPEEST